MAILLLIGAVILWAAAGLSGVIQIPVLAGIWLLAGGARELLAFVHRPRPS